MFSHKSLISLDIEAEALVDAKGFSNELRNPIQHLSEAKHFQCHLRFGAVLACREVPKMNPGPHIAKDQGNAHKKQSQLGIASAGFDLRFVHLAIAGFDAKTLAIDFSNLPRCAANLPNDIQQLLPATFACLFVRIAFAGNANRDLHADELLALLFFLLFRRRGIQRVGIVAAFSSPQVSQAAWLDFAILGFAPTNDDGNDERTIGPAQILNHFRAVKTLVQQEITDFYPSAADDRQQALDDVFHRHAILDAQQPVD